MSADTPVEDILGTPGEKPRMAKLCQAVFDRHDLASFRGFTQFRSAQDLAAIIEAKRKNVFDYGVCFVETDSGIRFPKNTSAVMAALKLAMDGKYDSIDLRAIGLVDADGNPVVQINELCPGASSAPASKAKPKPPPEPDPEPEVEPEQEVDEVEADPEPEEPAPKPRGLSSGRMQSRKPNQANAPKSDEEEEGGQPAVLIDSGEILERLDKLGNDLADALQVVVDEGKKAAHAKNDIIEDEIGWVKNEIENLKAGFVGLAAFLNVVNNNLQMVGAYLDSYIEYEAVPDGVLDLLGMAIPEDIDERLQEVQESPKGTSVDVEPAPPEPEPEEAQEDPEDESEEDSEDEEGGAEASSGSDGDVTLNYTRDELSAMSHEELKDIAMQLGVPKADKIPFKTSLINRICQQADID